MTTLRVSAAKAGETTNHENKNTLQIAKCKMQNAK
jgi:hypothetical protein